MQTKKPQLRSLFVFHSKVISLRLLTGAVHLLDFLFRFAHKNSQKVRRSSLLLHFDAHRTTCPFDNLHCAFD